MKDDDRGETDKGDEMRGGRKLAEENTGGGRGEAK